MQCDVRKIAKLMKLKVWKLLPPWIEFDAAMLSPLRVQMMGSVVVSDTISCTPNCIPVAVYIYIALLCNLYSLKFSRV